MDLLPPFNLKDITSMLIPVAAGIALASAAAALGGAVRSGVFKKLIFGSIEIETSPKEQEEVRSLAAAISDEKTETIPFETKQLAHYYSQILSQSKISFWFSLVFASIGFLVIIAAAFLYSENKVGAAVAQFVAGTIIDAIAALFFFQSRNSQKAMSEFFEKLRLDRRHSESRRLCESIENTKARDALRTQLCLHFANVPNDGSLSAAMHAVAAAQETKSEA